LIPLSPNLVAGANESGYHLLHVNYTRDFTAHVVADITAAVEGDACPNCGEKLRLTRGVEIGNIFKLGTRYTDALGCNFTDEKGEIHPVIMGSYGIGVGRLLACVAEEHHDEKGLIWPVSIAPVPVHIVVLPGKQLNVMEFAERLEKDLLSTGIDCLMDDRIESAGVKFNDADLIGIPLRITVSERGLKNGEIELKKRAGGDAWLIKFDDAVVEIKKTLDSMK
jgi:prolyl-tRNA synthetase